MHRSRSPLEDVFRGGHWPIRVSQAIMACIPDPSPSYLLVNMGWAVSHSIPRDFHVCPPIYTHLCLYYRPGDLCERLGWSGPDPTTRPASGTALAAAPRPAAPHRAQPARPATGCRAGRPLLQTASQPHPAGLRWMWWIRCWLDENGLGRLTHSVAQAEDRWIRKKEKR